MTIIVTNKKCRILCTQEDMDKGIDLYKELKILLSAFAKNYEKSNKYNTYNVTCLTCGCEFKNVDNTACDYCPKGTQTAWKRVWDGKIRFINYKLEFDTGFLPYVVDLLLELGFGVEFIDNRKNKIYPEDGVTNIGAWDLRDYQQVSLDKCLYNDLEEMYFPRGILNAATNAGKNSVIAGLCFSFCEDILILVHREELFKQLVKFLGTDCELDISQYGLGKKQLGNITIAMYKTMLSGSKSVKVKVFLEKTRVLIVDECHRTSAATYIKLIAQINAYARFFVSGTPLDGDDLQNMNVIKQSGAELHKITNQYLIDNGFSQRPTVLMFEYEADIYELEDYDEEVTRMKFNTNKLNIIKQICIENPTKQILIVVEHIDHGEFLLNELIEIPSIIEFVHGSDKERESKLENFKLGKIQVMISSMIIEEGVNAEHIQIEVLAFGGKSTKRLKQVIGRALRHDGVNDGCFIVDFMDKGRRLSKQVQKRLDVYHKEKFKVCF